MHVHCMCVRTAMPMHACAHAVPNLTATCIISIGRILAAFSLSLSLSLSLSFSARVRVFSLPLSPSLSPSLSVHARACVCVCVRARARACVPLHAHIPSTAVITSPSWRPQFSAEVPSMKPVMDNSPFWPVNDRTDGELQTHARTNLCDDVRTPTACPPPLARPSPSPSQPTRPDHDAHSGIRLIELK